MVRKVVYYECNKRHTHSSFDDAIKCDKECARKSKIVETVFKTMKPCDDYDDNELDKPQFYIKNEEEFELFSKWVEKEGGYHDIGNYDHEDSDNEWQGEGWYFIQYRVREYTGCTNYNFILKKINLEEVKE